MADGFGIHQVVDYLQQMGLQIASVDHEQEIVELAFHGTHGQWRMIISFQQSCQVRKLVLIAPHISTITRKKRLECLEALLAANYRTAMGKFGLDLDDGEVRLEEAVPLANDSITLSQFQLALKAMAQTVSMYYSLIPRIIYGNTSTQAALLACEQEFFQEAGLLAIDLDEEYSLIEEEATHEEHPGMSELNTQDILAEVARMLEEHPEA